MIRQWFGSKMILGINFPLPPSPHEEGYTIGERTPNLRLAL